MSNEYPQPVEPMSRAESILRGNETVVPMSRIEDLLKQLIAGGGGGSTVTITTDYQSGTKIATLTIDGTDYNVYIPTDQIGSIVSITTDYQSGTKIATLTIDNTDYNIYIPQDQVGAKTYSGNTDPSAALGANGDLYFKMPTDTNSETLYTEAWTPRSMGTVIEVQYSDVVSVFNTVTVNIHNIGDLTFDYSDLPVSDDPATDGYTWHDEWNFTEFKISRDDTNIYFTITRWEGTGTWVFQSCSISYAVVTGISDCFIKLEDWMRFANECYSTTERVVGIWTDGSPIYQITHFIGSTVTLDPSNWYEYTSFDASIISNLIDIHCFGQENGTGRILDSKIVDVGIENSHLQFLSLRNGNDFISGFTIKYTKVTT